MRTEDKRAFLFDAQPPTPLHGWDLVLFLFVCRVVTMGG